MPHKLTRTPAQDARIKRLRAEGETWDAIASALLVSRFTAIDRGRRIGATRPPRTFQPPPEDPARAPLPPGHPRSWRPLTAGTVLQDVAYPLPVFDV
jgi:hypothetical protein